MTERRARHSIKRRLLVVLLATILLAWIATLLLSYRDARHELDELLDAHLAQSASLLIAQVGHEVDDIDTEHAPPVHRYSRKVAFQIWEKGQRLLLHSASAPNVPLSPQRDGFSDNDIAGERWRVFSAWDERQHFLVQVGERREARDELVLTIAKHLLQPLLITLPLLGLLIWFGVARGLRPLQALVGQVVARRPDNLAPLEVVAAPVEVGPLVEGLNQLFDRVRVSLESERRFTADAAHELRTPLAAIKTQAQVARAATAEVERRHALDNVLVGCDRAAHLVEQLLTLARLEPGSAALKQPERCDLYALARAAVAALAPAAVDKDIDLQLAEADALHVSGEPALLAILLRNLIDNAIRYSPRHSVVQVRVANAGNGAELTVIDQGPGIPAESRALVWERFYRVLGTGEAGSGLGLSIAKRIADLHGATIALSEGDAGRGLRVSVIFPA
jgi:two-component system sensor histidine kinase QseC